MSTLLRDIVQATVPISHRATQAIEELTVDQAVAKGELFIERGKRNNSEYFVLEGICQSFLIDPEGQKVTLSFYGQGSVLAPHTTRTVKERATINFQALTDVKLGVIDAKAFETLMIEDLDVRTFGNTVLHNELMRKVDKEIGMATLTAKERLMRFREQFPMYENLIPHSDIASYLGITTISLSRLRSERAG